MPTDTLHIKNMVCRRLRDDRRGYMPRFRYHGCQGFIGKCKFQYHPRRRTNEYFYDRLRAVGFEPLKSHEHIMLENIKAAIRFYARHNSDEMKYKLSEFISDSIKVDFRYASRMFSSIEGRTIQSYLMSQRIEYVKELLFDNELTLAEIADRVGFSSVAHLSRTFKKSLGVTISEFRNTGTRMGIDEL